MGGHRRALEGTSLPIATAVTCPTMRIHPAVIAQAATTAAVQLGGRFVLGVGSGEALHEHTSATRGPRSGPAGHARGGGISDQCAAPGREISHHGRHYTVQDARIYTRPEEPVPIYVSGFAPQAAELAGPVGDGYCLAMPDAAVVRAFRAAGGGHKPVRRG